MKIGKCIFIFSHPLFNYKYELVIQFIVITMETPPTQPSISCWKIVDHCDVADVVCLYHRTHHRGGVQLPHQPLSAEVAGTLTWSRGPGNSMLPFLCMSAKVIHEILNEAI